MNIKKKKEELVIRFNQVNSKLVEFTAAREQIRGMIILLEQQEGEEESIIQKGVKGIKKIIKK